MILSPLCHSWTAGWVLKRVEQGRVQEVGRGGGLALPFSTMKNYADHGFTTIK